MKQTSTLVFFILMLCAFGLSAQIVFINEIHYNNVGTDTDEFIEIAGPAGTDIFPYRLYLYNGSNGTIYNEMFKTGTIPDEGNGFGAIAYNYPIGGINSNGIQNGSPDGIALVHNGVVIQFLSYGGTFTATNGPAVGLTSTDIGVSEPSDNPIGQTLQLIGTGATYSDFSWIGPVAVSKGTINAGQTFEAQATPDNDVCGNATVLVCGQEVAGSNAGATNEAVGISCFNSGEALRGIWYEFVYSGPETSLTISNPDASRIGYKLVNVGSGCETPECVPYKAGVSATVVTESEPIENVYNAYELTPGTTYKLFLYGPLDYTTSLFLECPPGPDCVADAGYISGDTEICEGDVATYTVDFEDDPNGIEFPEVPQLNEIRLDQPGADDDEYVEILGTPGASLDNITLVVIGDGSGGSGTIEEALDLSGNAIGDDGIFLIGMASLSLATPDLVVSVNLENSDNVTYLLVENFTGASGDDLDSNDDGVLDTTPWSSVLDGVAAIEEPNPPSGTEFEYGTDLGLPVIGPDGSFVPGHLFVDQNGNWQIGEFSVGTDDTPGDANFASEFIYVWVATTGAPDYTIMALAPGANLPPYTGVFDNLAAGSYCIHGLSFQGTFDELLQFVTDNNVTTGIEVATAIENEVICADLIEVECITLNVAAPPVADAGDDQLACEGDLVTLSADPGDGTGSWSGGLGDFDDPTDPGTIYTPAEGEVGTVILTWTTDGNGACGAVSDEVAILYTPKPDPSFSYPQTEYCPSDDNPVPTINGVNIASQFTAQRISGIGELDIDPVTGEITLDALNVNGTFEITHTASDDCGKLMISGAIDGPLSGGLPKAIEFYVIEDIADLSNYTVKVAFNGNSNFQNMYTFPAGTATAGSYIYASNDQTQFESFFGFSPDFANTQINFNGDDVIALFCGDTMIDALGELGTDGTGEAWEFLDSWTYRNDNNSPGAFDSNDWTFPGPNVLDGEETNDGADTPMPIGTFATDFEPFHCSPEEATTTIVIYPPLGQGTCNDLVHVTLTDNCDALFTADMGLEGNYPCYRSLNVQINDNKGNVVAGPELGGVYISSDYAGQTLYFEIMDPLSGAGCWGEVKVEDKTAPVFDCEGPQYVDSGNREVNGQVHEGSFDATLDFGVYSCFKEAGMSPISCERGYTVIKNVEPTETGFYTFINVMDGEGMISIHQGGFDPAEPCSNIIGQSTEARYGTAELDDFTDDGQIRLVLPLRADEKYDIVITTNDDLCRENADFFLFAIADKPDATLKNFSTDEDATVRISTPLYCDDVDHVFNNEESLEYIPEPVVFADCGEIVDTWFEDVKDIGAGDCNNEIYIYRTWYARDEYGNEAEACVQTIKFRLPTLEDIVRPPVTVPIECDEDAPLDESGHPHPDISGYPFIPTLNGIIDLNESYCNIGADYNDISVIDVCDNTQKIIRQWTILDWCNVGGQNDLNNGTAVNYRQIIKVGDFTAPEVTIDDPNSVVGTGPFACAGNLLISSLTVEDNCSASYTADVTVYELVEVPVLDKYGQDTGETAIETNVFAEGLTEGNIVSGVVLGNTYKVHYEVEDACGNTTVVYYEVTIADKIEPVAVCDDDLHISIGGEGIGRVTAEDVDEGSWDNCELKDIYVSRKLVDDATRDAYLDEVYGITFSDLRRVNQADLDNSSDADVYVLRTNLDMEVLRRKDGMWFTWWRPDIWFLCIDMGLDVTIELLARDVYYNTNVCWLDVLIEDKVAPYCYAPDDVDIDCTDLPYGFDPEDDDQLAALFGVATATDNCAATAELVKSEVKYWECNSGKIVRYFSATDDKGTASLNTCKQTIIVNRVHDYEIKFPKDAASDCESPMVDTIETKEIACDLLSVNVYDERFEASGDACYKIKRTYKVINWCEYDGESEPIVVDRDHDCNGVTGDEDIWVLVRADGDVFYDRNNNEEDENPKEYERGCSPENPDGYWEKNTQFGNAHYDYQGNEVNSLGYWQYSQFIKVYDNTPPTIEAADVDDICSIAADCAADVSVDAVIEDFCAGDDLTVKVFLLPDAATGLSGKVDLQVAENADLVNFVLSGTYPNFNMSGRFPLGDHAFEVHAVDGCQNSEIAIIPFSVIDCKAPTPICINGLAVELMPIDGEEGGMMDIWASDFQVSGLDDCSGIEGLYITRDADGDDAEKSAELVLTCDDPDTLAVRIWAVDNAGNADYCLTYVLVQDNLFGLCDPITGPAVSGLIATELDEAVEDVEVRLSGAESKVQMTSVAGEYGFVNLEMGGDYTIAPQKNDGYLNGVSTFDLVLMTKHILGTRKLDSPYKLIAADVNRSGSVSTLDLIQLRKLVLSIDRSFRNNTSWRFVPRDYVFPNEENPWTAPFPEVISENDVFQNMLKTDFVAIKIGDVNGSAIANSLVTENRNLTGTFALQVAEQKLLAGNEYRVSFTAPLGDIQGYQFTLNYEGLELVDIEYGLAQEEHFGIIEDGVITTSWNGSDFRLPNSELFTLVVRANVDAQLSDLLKVSSRYTQAEAYNTGNELMHVALTFNGAVVTEGYELHQNQPNPFEEVTMIGFSLPQAAQATIRISDVRGRTLKLIRGDYAKGYNQINLNSSELSSGVLYYTLETGDFTATRKMVLIGE